MAFSIRAQTARTHLRHGDTAWSFPRKTPPTTLRSRRYPTLPTCALAPPGLSALTPPVHTVDQLPGTQVGHPALFQEGNLTRVQLPISTVRKSLKGYCP